MRDAKFQRRPDVETLEVPEARLAPVVAWGGRADARAPLRQTALFNPSQYVEWFGGTCWRGRQACRAVLAPSPAAHETGDPGYRLPIIWGSSSRH